MCGLVGVIGTPVPDERTLHRMRDALTHRGPDDAGVWFGDGAALGHRRLTVIDPTEAGAQPMVDGSGRFALAYNGELYNDADLRASLLEQDGTSFASSCDTETVLRWLAAGRPLGAMRGMYAIAMVDTARRTLTLARDPLGIKPLYWARLSGRVVFASEPAALFEHSDLSARPDPVGVGVYLTTIRTVLGDRTMFEGVRAVEPGQVLTFDLDRPEATPRVAWIDQPEHDAATTLRSVVDASIDAHLRTDVPLGAMLSGGLDSTIIVDRAASLFPNLRTYVAGGMSSEGDPGHAQRVAERLGTTHTRIAIDQPMFAEWWLRGIDDTGVPLSTPNEVAIRLVAQRARADGVKVLLTGEGADELFAGYDAPMQLALALRARHRKVTGEAMAEALAWVDRSQLAGVVGPSLSECTEGFAYASGYISDALGPMETDERLRQLDLQRRVNLVGLLGRLDTATMLESVEGRTPFADVAVAAAAGRIRPELLYNPSGSTMASRTKLVLRRAYADRVPPHVSERDKASFPLPFQEWIGGLLEAVAGLNEEVGLVSPAAIAAIGRNPEQSWQAAWPMFNLVLWGSRWWGGGLGRAIDGQLSAASTRGTAASSSRVYGWTGS